MARICAVMEKRWGGTWFSFPFRDELIDVEWEREQGYVLILYIQYRHGRKSVTGIWTSFESGEKLGPCMLERNAV